MQLATHFTLCVLLATVTWQFATGQEYYKNLLRNPSFELPLKGTWKGSGFVPVQIKDAKEGTYSLKVSEREEEISGPTQDQLETCRGCHYVFEGWIKLLRDSKAKIWQSLKVVVTFELAHDISQSYTIAKRSFCDTTQGWIFVKGSIEAPQKDIERSRISIRGPDPNIPFLVDNVTLYAVPELADWRAQADRNIEEHRKSDVKIIARLPKDASASDYELQVTLKAHLFPFGSLMRDAMMLVRPINAITKLALYMFNWASVQSYKWKFNKGEPEDTNPDFSNAQNLTDFLRKHGVKVRGHSIFWNLRDNIPDWVAQTSRANLHEVLKKHEEYMIHISNGKLEQMDIQNEHIAGHYYEDKLRDKDVSKDMFKWAEELHYSAEFFLNEYQCITSGSQTEQYYDLAMEYLKEGIHVHGLGVQGHTKEFVKPDPTAMWRRIDRLAQTGLKIMMTEFDIGWHHIRERADWLEDAIRAFFGHPKMNGIILWDFFEPTMRYPHHGLVDGTEDNPIILEPGERWICLLKKEWTTNERFSLADGTAFSLRGFQGDYDVVVKYKGKPVQKETFHLGKNNTRWLVKIDKNTEEISIPSEPDYVPKCISHRDERSMGTIRSSSTDSRLTCETRFSAASGPAESVSVPCEADEIMTDCSSIHVNVTWARKGEKIHVNATSKKVVCTAYNGDDIVDSRGVRAFARCCKLKGLTCDYKAAGPSFPFDGAMAEARCDAKTFALGCSTYSPYPDSDGVKPKEDASSCMAQSGKPVSTNPVEKSGALVYSVCCNTTSSLTCEVVTSPTAKVPKPVSYASCSDGYVMTGCSGFAEDGKIAGARIMSAPGGQDRCRAQLGTDIEGRSGVKAYATCCKA